MGAYSSYPLFALTHGFLVSYLGFTCGVKSDTFKILGDDIVIRDDVLASRYRDTLRGYDIPISNTKTMSSKTTFEFAKR